MMTDFIEVYDTEILLVESDDGNVLEYVGSAIIVMPNTGGGGTGAVESVNGKTGIVELHAEDVGADPAGTAEALLNINTDFVGLINATMEI